MSKKIEIKSDNPLYNELIMGHNEREEIRAMPKINVGDVVKKKACKNTGPEAWVTVLEKKSLWETDDDSFYGYTVLQPDGSVATYTDAVLSKRRDIYA